MTNDDLLLGGAFKGGRQEKLDKDADTAKMVIMAVIGAGQQVLVEDYKFTEAEVAAWAGFVPPMARAMWDILKPELPPPNDKEYMKIVAQFVLNIGAQILQTKYKFTPEMTGAWMLRTTKLVSAAAGAEARQAAKRLRKPKVNR